MSQTSTASVEDILKRYSIDSEQGAEMLFSAVLKLSPDDAPIKPENLSRFLERFPGEKSFGNILEDAISVHRTSIDRLSRETAIPQNLLEKVIHRLELPNIIPVKKMKVLLDILHIPMGRAIESIRASLTRLKPEGFFIPISGAAPGRRRKRDFNLASSERSRESLKRSLEAYIDRLVREDI
jgi:hypothetical protein